MRWQLSRFRAGDLVQVRSREEILATLDADGCLEGMPFMPEMLQYCGRQVRVGVVAHKSCDTVRKTWTGRRVQAAVHLEKVRCDGSAHDGCQADCNIYWKDAWLKPIESTSHLSTNTVSDGRMATTPLCTEQIIYARTRVPSGPQQEQLYSCQATQLYEASESLPWWDLRQYVYDVTTRNYPARRVLTVLWLFMLRWMVQHTPFAFTLIKRFSERMHLRLTGSPAPGVNGKVEQGQRTPTGRLDLKLGERVRIKPLAQIEQTLDVAHSNRGMFFDYEMVPFCGEVFTVRDRVSRIIDESNGKMLQMKEPCITLDGVVCTSQYNACRLLCPRAIRPYWREIWLERVDADPTE